MSRSALLAPVVGVLTLSAAALASEAGGDRNIFNADIGNFLFTVVIFGLVIFLLGKFAWKPLLNVLNEREATIRESLRAARHEREEAERKLAEYQAQLDRAREEASAIVAEGRRDAEVARQRIQEEARRAAEEIAARARRDIQLATDAAVKELYDQAAELAVRVAGRIIRKELSADDHQQLVAESIRAIESAARPKMN